MDCKIGSDFDYFNKIVLFAVYDMWWHCINSLNLLWIQDQGKHKTKGMNMSCTIDSMIASFACHLNVLFSEVSVIAVSN